MGAERAMAGASAGVGNEGYEWCMCGGVAVLTVRNHRSSVFFRYGGVVNVVGVVVVGVSV